MESRLNVVFMLENRISHGIVHIERKELWTSISGMIPIYKKSWLVEARAVKFIFEDCE